MILKNLLDKIESGTRLCVLVNGEEFTITMSQSSYDYLEKYLTYKVSAISAGVNVINILCGNNLL